MDLADENDSGHDERDDVDIVSAWLLKLAIAMLAVGVLFVALDQYHVFHESTEQLQIHHLAVAG